MMWVEVGLGSAGGGDGGGRMMGSWALLKSIDGW